MKKSQKGLKCVKITLKSTKKHILPCQLATNISYLKEKVFDFPWRQILSSPNNNVLDTPHNTAIPKLINCGKIARVHPPILYRLGRLFRVVPVAYHRVSASNNGPRGVPFMTP